MPTINRLSAIDALAGGDQLPVYDTSNGDARRASLSLLDSYLSSSLTSYFASKVLKQTASVTATGQTVQVNDDSDHVWLIIKPSANYAAGTLKMPAVGNCVDGQEVIVHSTKTFTAFTVDGNGASLFGCTFGTGYAAGTRHVFRFNATDTTWYGDIAI